MGTLEDQIKQWKKQADSQAAPAPAAKAPAPPLSKRAAKKKAPLQTIRREEPKAPTPPKPAPAQTDEELFAAAVEGISHDAVLDKFSAAPEVKVKGERLQPSAPKDDATLFREFVGDLPKR